MNMKTVLLVALALCSFVAQGDYDIYVKNKSGYELKCTPSYCSAYFHPSCGGKAPCGGKPFETMSIKIGDTAKFTAYEESQLGSVCIEEGGKTYAIDSSLKDWKKRMSTQTWTYLGNGTVKIKTGKP